MAGKVQQRIGLGDGHAHWPVRHLHNFILISYFALLQHLQVEARPVMLDQQRRHARLIHTDTDPVASDARLRHFEECVANAIPVTNTNLVVREAIDGEVLAELAVRKVFAPKLVFQVSIGACLIHEDRTMLTAVSREISLDTAVSIVRSSCIKQAPIDTWKTSFGAKTFRTASSARTSPSMASLTTRFVLVTGIALATHSSK